MSFISQGAQGGTYIAAGGTVTATNPVVMNKLTGAVTNAANMLAPSTTFASTQNSTNTNFFNQASPSYNGYTGIYLGSNRTLYLNRNGSFPYNHWARVATYTGTTTYTLGNSVTWGATNNSIDIGIAHLISTDKVLVTYVDYANNSYLTAVILTFVGDVITVGTPVVISTSAINNSNTAYSAMALTSTTAYITYSSGANIYYQIVTITGDVISLGTEKVLSANNATYISVYQISSSNFIAVYSESSTNIVYAGIGTIAGGTASISWTYVTTFIYGAVLNKTCIAYYQGSSTFVFGACQNGFNSYVVACTFSGTTITASNYFSAATNGGNYPPVFTMTSNNAGIIMFYNGTSLVYAPFVASVLLGLSLGSTSITNGIFIYQIPYDSVNNILYTPYTGSTANFNRITPMPLGINFNYAQVVGFANTSAAAGTTFNLTSNGNVQTGLSNLIAGATYYLDSSTGALTTTVTSYKIGFALSVSSIVVNYQ